MVMEIPLTKREMQPTAPIRVPLRMEILGSVARRIEVLATSIEEVVDRVEDPRLRNREIRKLVDAANYDIRRLEDPALPERKPRISRPLTSVDVGDAAGRFWEKVLIAGPDDCWPWQSSVSRGHGTLFLNGRPEYAHKIAHVLQNGDVPAGMNVLHRCDNPPCCNGRHLFLGTQQDNMDDMRAKGRQNYTRAKKT